MWSRDPLLLLLQCCSYAIEVAGCKSLLLLSARFSCLSCQRGLPVCCLPAFPVVSFLPSAVCSLDTSQSRSRLRRPERNTKKRLKTRRTPKLRCIPTKRHRRPGKPPRVRNADPEREREREWQPEPDPN